MDDYRVRAIIREEQERIEIWNMVHELRQQIDDLIAEVKDLRAILEDIVSKKESAIGFTVDSVDEDD